MRHKHGGAGTKLYAVWKAMRQRCRNTKNKRFNCYGGRGISICKEWEIFEAFRDWALSHGYKAGLTLDRIDNDKDYGPANCRWVTYEVQNNNTRHNHYLTIGDETLTIAQWARKTGVRYKTIWARVNAGKTPEECIYRGKLCRTKKPYLKD